MDTVLNAFRRSPRSDRFVWITTTLGLVLTALTFRAVVNFADVYPPGIDAGYYPMQVRELLTHGRLMYDDLPLLFWLVSAIGKLFMAAGWQPDEAILLGSRLFDSAAPPCAAVAIMAVGYDWSGGRRSAIVGCAACAGLAILSPPAFAMLSEFQKNSLGLTWLAAAVWAANRAMRHGGAAQSVVVAGILVLSAMTHLGALAVTLGMMTTATVIWRTMRWRRAPQFTEWRAVTRLTFGLASVFGLLFYVEPHRAAALINPLDRFGNIYFGVGPRTFAVAVQATVYVVVAFGLRSVWRDRRDVAPAQVALVVSAAAAAALLAAPLRGEEVNRLILMAPVPAAIVLTFVMARRAVAGASQRPARALLVVAVLLAAVGPRFVHDRLIDEPRAAELRLMRQEIAAPDLTLVIAPHGLEWWAGFFLHTRVRQGDVDEALCGSTKMPDLSRYRQVLLLRFSPKAPTTPSTIAPAPSAQRIRRIRAGGLFELYELEYRQ